MSQRVALENHFVVDVESDGPCPGIYSMVSFGVVAAWDMEISFKGLTAPISDKYVSDALAISEISRETHVTYPDPVETMARFVEWLTQLGLSSRPVMWSDNPAFDWQFINYYLHKYHGENPFGFSARRIGDLYAGHVGDIRKASACKKLRRTQHTHDPVDDARGNAEALNTILGMMED